MRYNVCYDAGTDGELFSEKEIIKILFNHYMYYNSMPWFMRIYYKPWITLLDSLVQFLAPTYVNGITERASVLAEVASILKESSNENSDS